MKTRYTFLSDLESHRFVECDNCSWTGEERDTQAIADLDQRIAPGEIVPVGECPNCGCLCHYAKEKAQA